MTDQQKYTSLRGNQNASKLGKQKKQGFTLHTYVPYPYVEAIRAFLGEEATQKQVQDYAFRVYEDAMESHFTREHNAEYLEVIKTILLHHSGRQFEYTYASNTSIRLSLESNGLWYGEVSGGIDPCSASSFGEVVDSLRLNGWMDQNMLELVTAFEKQANAIEGDKQ